MEYDEIFEVTLETSTEDAWKVLKEIEETIDFGGMKMTTRDNVDMFDDPQEQAIICAINCIHGIISEYHEKNCPHICLALGEGHCRDFMKLHSCRYFRDIMVAFEECEDPRMLKLREIIYVDFTEEYKEEIGI